MKAKKVTECPTCDSDDLHDKWVTGRKLQQGCNDCGWKGKHRTPEIKPIKNTKTIRVNQFLGFHFEIFDKYGCSLISSKAYHSETDARKDIAKDLAAWNKNPDVGPCTAILWPPSIEVTGEIIK